ncbi:hypothetical protein Rs2_38260 [Raphanus sativus]|nr:hypothetical protein Rs2_38260 [Raphanus sativus]
MLFRIGKHLGEFESLFLADIDNGEMADKSSYSGLEVETYTDHGSTLRLTESLLSIVERLTNNGSLAGIDALLGCPLHLPSSKLNAFSSQIDKRDGCISQATEKDVTTKLLKATQKSNIPGKLIEQFDYVSPQSLPELHPYSATSEQTEHPERKNEKRKLQDDASQRKGNMKHKY